MLYFIGLGLSSEKDITVSGLEVVKNAERVYLEAYTSILPGIEKEKMEKFYGREIILADRDMVEQDSETMLDNAKNLDVAFLVVGDPFGATTHSDLWVRAKQSDTPTKIIHNASIMNAVGSSGLQLYRFGETISMCFFQDTWRPDSFYEKMKYNRLGGLHTLCLLDIKVKEQNIENLMRGRKIFEPPRYMTIRQCIDQLLEIEELRGENVYSEETMCVGIARIGSDTQQIVAGTMKELRGVDFGGPLHSFIVTGHCHIHELETLVYYATDKAKVDIENDISTKNGGR